MEDKAKFVMMWMAWYDTDTIEDNLQKLATILSIGAKKDETIKGICENVEWIRAQVFELNSKLGALVEKEAKDDNREIG